MKTDELREKYTGRIHFNCKDGDEAFTDGYVLWLEEQLINYHKVQNLTKGSQLHETPMKSDPLLGTVVSFPEDNEMVMFQDFRFWKGIPSNIEFKIESIANKWADEFWLVADGYGNLSKPNSYGNGKIAVERKYILEALSLK